MPGPGEVTGGVLQQDPPEGWSASRRGPPSAPPPFPCEPEFLLAIARSTARTCPSLAPLGGTRWTPEDVAHAVSELVDIASLRAFRDRVAAGMGSTEQALYLAKSLRYGLLRGAMRRCRDSPLPDEGPPAPPALAMRLPPDAEGVVGSVALRIQGRLGKGHRAVLAAALGDPGALHLDLAARVGISGSTWRRRWREAGEVCGGEARRAGLGPEEEGEVWERLKSSLLGEPGAGSREPGAGSREPGAGSGERGAGSPWRRPVSGESAGFLTGRGGGAT